MRHMRCWAQERVIRTGGRGWRAVTASNQAHPARRERWLRRRKVVNQMRRSSCRNPASDRQLCGMP
jgi:hypothetical protein